MTKPDTAVLLTFHGTISEPSEIGSFLTKIRRGRPASEELVQEVERRYAAIGGSPLLRESEAQARALAARLEMPTFVAGRLWSPWIEDVVARMVADGVATIISVPLAPLSVHVYHQAVREAARRHGGVVVREAPPYGEDPELKGAFLSTIEEARRGLPADVAARVPIVLTAHSLPTRVVDSGDPYAAQFQAMAASVAAPLRAQGAEVHVAYQSQGAAPGEWLGPDLRSTFSALASQGAPGVVVAPIGFLAEHVETLYDLDIEARAIAKEVGIPAFSRAATVGCHSGLIEALARVAREAEPA